MVLGVFLYRFFTKGLLSQIKPAFFINKLDFTTWIVQATGLTSALLNNFALCVLFEAVYFLLPFVYLWAYAIHSRLMNAVGIAVFTYGILYSVVYCSFPIDSIETHIALMVFPIVFIPKSLQGFSLMLDAARYFFIYFFASAGVWKLMLGGVFNIDQMSGILVQQHKEVLTSNHSGNLHSFYWWLITHRVLAYCLYALSTAVELFFIVGFFTKKLDRLLMFLYLGFVIADFLVMRIDYFRTLPILLCFIYSKYHLNDKGDGIRGRKALNARVS